MDPQNPFHEDLIFPVDCHYKVIAEDTLAVHARLEKALQDIGIDKPVLIGNRSSKGTYITFNITITVESKEIMERIDATLRNTQGVRMVL
jgi:putative lipoic acid-binding regulatory protein